MTAMEVALLCFQCLVAKVSLKHSEETLGLFDFSKFIILNSKLQRPHSFLDLLL